MCIFISQCIVHRRMYILIHSPLLMHASLYKYLANIKTFFPVEPILAASINNDVFKLHLDNMAQNSTNKRIDDFGMLLHWRN